MLGDPGLQLSPPHGVTYQDVVGSVITRCLEKECRLVKTVRYCNIVQIRNTFPTNQYGRQDTVDFMTIRSSRALLLEPYVKAHTQVLETSLAKPNKISFARPTCTAKRTAHFTEPPYLFSSILGRSKTRYSVLQERIAAQDRNQDLGIKKALGIMSDIVACRGLEICKYFDLDIPCAQTI